MHYEWRNKTFHQLSFNSSVQYLSHIFASTPKINNESSQYQLIDTPILHWTQCFRPLLTPRFISLLLPLITTYLSLTLAHFGVSTPFHLRLMVKPLDNNPKTVSSYTLIYTPTWQRERERCEKSKSACNKGS